jgi:hypothetical protein
VVPQAFLLAFGLHYWVNHPEQKWLNWVLGILFTLMILMVGLGLLVG